MRQDISFSAKDAAKLVGDYNNLYEVESRQKYIEIVSIIVESAKKGNSSCEFNGWLSTVIINNLRQSGFTVETISNQREDSYTNVSW